jgi:hypothetical protein
MNRPAPFVRFAGNPFIGLVLLAVCVTYVVGWFYGHTTWVAALTGLLVGINTLSAVGRVRRYKVWKRDWDAVGEPQPLAKKGGRLPLLSIASLLLSIGVPIWLGSAHRPGSAMASDAMLSLLWGLAILYLVFKFIRGLVRWLMKPSREKSSAPVTWAIGTSTSNPSLKSSMRALPDYSLRLLSQPTLKGQ